MCSLCINSAVPRTSLLFRQCCELVVEPMLRRLALTFTGCGDMNECMCLTIDRDSLFLFLSLFFCLLSTRILEASWRISLFSSLSLARIYCRSPTLSSLSLSPCRYGAEKAPGHLLSMADEKVDILYGSLKDGSTYTLSTNIGTKVDHVSIG